MLADFDLGREVQSELIDMLLADGILCSAQGALAPMPLAPFIAVTDQQWFDYLSSRSEHWTLQGKTIPPEVVRFPFMAKENLAGMEEPIRARSVQLHTLGNLSLLNKYLNPAASNGSFAMKLPEYKHSVLRLNRYFDERTGWDEEAISERSRLLAGMLCKIWPRPSTSE
jgi:hypothetical protein